MRVSSVMKGIIYMSKENYIVSKQVKEIMSIVDMKSKLAVSTFISPSLHEAQRGFDKELNNPESQLNAYPEDYTLVHVGTVCYTTEIVDGFAKLSTTFKPAECMLVGFPSVAAEN